MRERNERIKMRAKFWDISGTGIGIAIEVKKPVESDTAKFD
jgi:hypothetical protein